MLALLFGNPPTDRDTDHFGDETFESGKWALICCYGSVLVIAFVHARGHDATLLHGSDEPVALGYLDGVYPISALAIIFLFEQGHSRDTLEVLIIKFSVFSIVSPII